jgi:nicotinamidase-related amidase
MPTVLLLVDVQRNMLGPPEPVPAAASVGAALAGLLDRARAAGAPVVHIRNNGSSGDPDAPGSPGWELIHPVAPGEHVVDKYEPDAFSAKELPGLVPASATVVVAGMQSEYCVRATSLAALSRGNTVVLARGAHATYDGEEPATAVSASVEAELEAAGVAVVDHDKVEFAG